MAATGVRIANEWPKRRATAGDVKGILKIVRKAAGNYTTERVSKHEKNPGHKGFTNPDQRAPQVGNVKQRSRK